MARRSALGISWGKLVKVLVLFNNLADGLTGDDCSRADFEPIICETHIIAKSGAAVARQILVNMVAHRSIEVAVKLSSFTSASSRSSDTTGSDFRKKVGI